MCYLYPQPSQRLLLFPIITWGNVCKTSSVGASLHHSTDQSLFQVVPKYEELFQFLPVEFSFELNSSNLIFGNTDKNSSLDCLVCSSKGQGFLESHLRCLVAIGAILGPEAAGELWSSPGSEHPGAKVRKPRPLVAAGETPASPVGVVGREFPVGSFSSGLWTVSLSFLLGNCY